MRRLALAAVLAAVSALLASPAHAAPRFELLSTNPPGTGSAPYVSATGRYVVWRASPGRNGAGDGTAQQAVLADRTRHTTEVVSVARDGRPSDAGGSMSTVEVSRDGRYVVFDSAANDLVPGDTNGATDVFLRDRRTRRTTRLSVDRHGRQAAKPSSRPHVSDDGSTVLFTSCANLTEVPKAPDTCQRLFVLRAGTLRLVTDAATGVTLDSAALSADGRFAAFTTSATLVKEDTATSRCRDDVYVYDVAHARLASVTHDLVSPGGEDCLAEPDTFDRPRLDATGRFVTFVRSGAGGASPVVVRRDLATGALTTIASLTGAQSTLGYDVTPDGRTVVYVGMTDGTPQGTPASGAAVMLVRAGGSPVRVSPPAASPLDRCPQAGLVDVVPACLDDASQPSISDDGKVLAFVTNVPISTADRTVSDDVYVRT
jgi:Tol biopolymer transport system component